MKRRMGGGGVEGWVHGFDMSGMTLDCGMGMICA